MGEFGLAEYLNGTEFEVRFGTNKVSFSKISNMSNRIDIMVHIEGGADHPYFLKSPKQKPDMLVFERAIDADTNFLTSFLGKLKEGQLIENVMIFIKHNGTTKRVLCFDYGMVLGKELSPMDAMGKSLMIEKLTVAHTGLKEMSTDVI